MALQTGLDHQALGLIGLTLAHDAGRILSAASLRAQHALTRDDASSHRAALEQCAQALLAIGELLRPLAEARRDGRATGSKLVHSAVGLAGALHPRCSFSCHGERDVHLAIDGGRLLAVLINLLDNAAKAGSRQVRVTVSRHSGDGSLIVEDDGPGVSPSVAERAFELGTSGDGGSGWGLAICRELVESVGGEIAYEPNPTGGSRFAVRVPLVAKRAAA